MERGAGAVGSNRLDARELQGHALRDNRRPNLNQVLDEPHQSVAHKDCPGARDTEAESDNCFQPILLVRHNTPRKHSRHGGLFT